VYISSKFEVKIDQKIYSILLFEHFKGIYNYQALITEGLFIDTRIGQNFKTCLHPKKTLT